MIKFLPRKDFQKVRSFVSLPVRGACNVKEFTWLQLSIIQLFFNYVVRTPRNNASRDRCHEKFRHVCNSVMSVLTKLGKTFYQNLLRCKKERKKGKSRWGKKRRCMLPLFCWGDSIWGHFTFHRLPAVPVFFAKAAEVWQLLFEANTPPLIPLARHFKVLAARHSIWCIRSLPCGFKDNAVVTLEAAILPKIFRFGKVRSWDLGALRHVKFSETKHFLNFTHPDTI